MRWRFNIYSTFTVDENPLIFGDFVNILHCFSNAFLTVDNIDYIEEESKLINSKNGLNRMISYSKTKKMQIFQDESEIYDDNFNLNHSIEAFDLDEDLIKNNYSVRSKFYIKQFDSSDIEIEVNSTWILENIFNSIKSQCFIRYHDFSKMDTYRMIFRIKNFKTGKYLSLKKLNNETDSDLGLGVLKGINKCNYKFGLVTGEHEFGSSLEDFLYSEEYQYSLFGFHPSYKTVINDNDASGSHMRAEKNQHLRIFHIATKSYLKIVKIDEKSLNDNNLHPCYLTLTHNENEQEVFKIIPTQSYTTWKFKYINNLNSVLKSVINHIMENISKQEENSTINSFFSSIRVPILKNINYVLKNLLKFITNQFINKYNPDYDFKSVVFNRQILISKFGMTRLILRNFLYDFWVGLKNMSNLLQLTRIIRKIKKYGEKYFLNLNRAEKIIYKMYIYTDSIFHFLIFYCKDNIVIKEELYENLDIFFYFVNLRQSCIQCLIEIFKDNPNLMHSIIRDCKNNSYFRRALVNIYKSYFVKRLNSEDKILKKKLKMDKNVIYFHNSNNSLLSKPTDAIKDSDVDEDINLIDLIFEYVKISEYEDELYNNINLLNKYKSDTSAVSLISRDKYFELLKSFVTVKSGKYILDNQRVIIEKLLFNMKEQKTEFTLINFLEKESHIIDYPPCLNELLVSVANENPDKNIKRFMKINFKIDRLFSHTSSNKVFKTKSIQNSVEKITVKDMDRHSVNLKLISYFIYSASNNLIQNDEFSKDVLKYYKKLIVSFESFFDTKGSIDYSHNSETNMLISTIKLIKTIYENDIPLKDVQSSDKLHEKKLITLMMNLITRSYFFSSNKNLSAVLKDTINKKQLNLGERIYNSKNGNYLQIAESWLKVYLVFKNRLNMLIDEKFELGILNHNDKFETFNYQTYGSKVSKKLSSKASSNKKKCFISNEQDDEKNLLIMNKEKDHQPIIVDQIIPNKQEDSFNLLKDNVVNLFYDNNNFKKFDSKNYNFYLPSELDENKKKKYDDKDLRHYDKRDTKLNDRDDLFYKIRSKKSTLINDEYMSRLKSISMKKISSLGKFHYMSQEFINSNITEEESKKSKKNVFKNILELFQLFIKKNIEKMQQNFIEYYKVNKEINDSTFDDFLIKCIPRLQSDHINDYIFKYSKIENKFICNLKKDNFEKKLINFNLLFETNADSKLNFVHNLMIVFNTADEPDLQEMILYLIYKLFTQRKKFFNKLMQYNEHIIMNFKNTKILLMNEDENSINSNFLNFFNYYEKTRHNFIFKEYNESFNFLILVKKELCTLFKSFFTNIKNEIHKFTDEVEEPLNTELENCFQLISNIENDEYREKNYKREPSVFDNIFKLYCFIRKNVRNSQINTFLLIIYQNSSIYSQLCKSVTNDFLEKAKILRKIPDLKKKYYTCLCLIILVILIVNPRNKKLLNLLNKVLDNNKGILIDDPYSTYLLLLAISDIQLETNKINYCSIMENIKYYNNILPSFHQNLNEPFSNEFTVVYIEIMNNILRYIVSGNKIISEENLEEIIIDNLIFLLHKIDYSFYHTENALRLISLLTITIKVECLFKMLKIKTEKSNNLIVSKDLILNKFPKPEDLIIFFKFYIKNGKNPNSLYNNIDSMKKSYVTFKYIIYYNVINPNYFSNVHLKPNKDKLENIMDLIKCVFYGFKNFMIDNKNLDNSNSLLEVNIFKDSPEKEFYEELSISNICVILNLFSVIFIQGNKDLLKFIDLDLDNSIENSSLLINDFIHRIYQEENILNSEKTYKFKDKTNLYMFKDLKYTSNLDNLYYITRKLVKFLKNNYTVTNHLDTTYSKLIKTSAIGNKKDNQLKQNLLDILNARKTFLKNQIIKSYSCKKDKFDIFKDTMWHNRKTIIEIGNSEASSLIYHMIYLLEKKNDKKYEDILITFLTKLIDFILKSSLYMLTDKTVKINNFFHYIIGEFIIFFDGKKEIDLFHLIKNNLREIQLLFERSFILKNSLQLICNHAIPKVQEQLPYIFENFNMLLFKGNDIWQSLFFKHFSSSSSSESVFKFIYSTISENIDSILTNRSNIIRLKKKKLRGKNLKLQFFNKEILDKLDSTILQFLQLLCENHNRQLQLFLLHQPNFRKSYDLVSLTNIYLQILFIHFNKNNFDPLIKCFDLLIEFIQGPCLENQVAMINSKLLITITEILEMYLKVDNIGNKQQISTINSHFSKMQISLLTFKCSILLLALIEARRKEDTIYKQIINNIKPELVEAIYKKISFQHMTRLIDSNELKNHIIRLRDLSNAGSVENAIRDNHGKDDSDLKIGEYLILETGFNLYFLFKYFKDYLKSTDDSLGKKLKPNNIKRLFDDRNIVYLFYLFIIDLSISIIKFLSTLFYILVYIFTFSRIDNFNVMKIFKKNKVLKYSKNFYKRYTKSIEILRDNRVYKINFFSYPFLRNFNNFEKTTFLESIDRTNAKTKLIDIVKFSNRFKYELEYDYKVKRFVNNIPIFGIIFNHTELWKDMSLFLSIVQNFFNIVAYFKKESVSEVCIDNSNYCLQVETFEEQKLFMGIEDVKFKTIVDFFATVQIFLVVIVVTEFFLRKTPSIIKHITEELNVTNPSQRLLIFIREFVLRTFLNFEVIYYLGYISAAILGYIKTDFFFAVLLLEVVTRFKTLKNVMMSIRNPAKELLLTFTLWFIIIYFFAIIAYSFLIHRFPEQKDCSSLVICWATIFYQNNKMDNGIGKYLIADTYGNDNRMPFNFNFLFDQSFNLIVKILIIQMVAGIIIDNFAKLRIEEMEMIKDMSSICTICGLKKDNIEKVYEKYGKKFESHIKKDHSIFNYIHYIIYLYKKDKTEFTGIESYVYNNVFIHKDISWFPTNK